MTTQPGTPPDPPSSPDGDPPVAAMAGLAREVEALRRRLDQLQALPTRVDQLADLLARQAETVAAADASPAIPEPLSWLDLPTDPGRPAESSAAAQAAEDLLTTLASWVGGVYLRYPDAAQTLPECWLWHPEVVEELLWLHTAWLTAHQPDAASTVVGDWHDPPHPRLRRRLLPRTAPTRRRPAHPRARRPARRRGASDRRLVGHPPPPAGAGTHRRAASRGTPTGTAAQPPMSRGTATTTGLDRDPGRRAIWAAGLAVAAGAGVATAHGLYQVAAAARVAPPIGWLYPLITDGLALVGYATARLRHGGRRYAAGIVVLAAGLSGLAQAVYLAGGLDHTTTAPVGLRFGVGAWPAIAAALTAHLLHLIGSGGSSTSASAPPAADQPASTAPSTAPSTASYNPALYNAPSNSPVQRRPNGSRPTGPVQPTEPERLYNSSPPQGDADRKAAGGSARDRARAAARHHHARHGVLPTVTEVMNLANVARGTAANALKDLRAERPALHLVNTDTENRTDQ